MTFYFSDFLRRSGAHFLNGSVSLGLSLELNEFQCIDSKVVSYRVFVCLFQKLFFHKGVYGLMGMK